MLKHIVAGLLIAGFSAHAQSVLAGMGRSPAEYGALYRDALAIHA